MFGQFLPALRMLVVLSLLTTLRGTPPSETFGALVPKLSPKIRICCCAVSISTVAMVASFGLALAAPYAEAASSSTAASALIRECR